MTAAHDPLTVDAATASSIRAQATVMLRGSLLWALPLVVVAAVVATIVRSSPGLIGSLVGSVVAVGSGLASVLVMRRTAAAIPTIVVGVMSVLFFAKLLLFLVLFLLLRGTTLFDVSSFAFTLLAVTLGWTVGECVGLARAVSRAAPGPVTEESR